MTQLLQEKYRKIGGEKKKVVKRSFTVSIYTCYES